MHKIKTLGVFIGKPLPGKTLKIVCCLKALLVKGFGFVMKNSANKLCSVHLLKPLLHKGFRGL
ncbi:hypothetical protein BUE76_03775 [Cnuella takakiae]|nr:hypothetical protein BUE76_03775 [Cnuella takakiae]